MHYSQFCSAISDILRKNSDPGTQFIQKALCKNNGVCPDVLFALPADSALGPVVYLEPLYDQYQKGIPMETYVPLFFLFWSAGPRSHPPYARRSWIQNLQKPALPSVWFPRSGMKNC